MKQRQIAFCEAYIACGNATEAAIKAGYSPRTARSQGHRLLTNADIQRFIATRNEELKSARIADVSEVRTFWTQTMRENTVLMRDRLKASELLGKSVGAFEDKQRSAESEVLEAWIQALCGGDTKECSE